jgi:hypothetical protein
MNQPPKKIDQLKALMAQEKWKAALSLAAKFPDLGSHKKAIEQAHGCLTNPRFFAQLGIDCTAAVEAGKLALVQRYQK